MSTIVAHTIIDLPQADRPRERLADRGSSALSNAELLAVLLGSGGRNLNAVQLGQAILVHTQGLAGLQQATLHELRRIPHIGTAKASILLAALELGKRISKSSIPQGANLTSPEMVAKLLQSEMGLLDQEHLRTVIVDTRNRLIAIHEVYRGSLNASQIRIGEVFREAIRSNAAGIIVTHNHPSGDPSPSPEDIRTTRLLIEAGHLLDIPVIDHIIFGRGRYVSLRERGLAFAEGEA
jgi:DNA repair protein RadC